jgi:hypothetical protein
MVAMMKKNYERSDILEHKIDVHRLRYHSDEDEADIMAVRALGHMGEPIQGLNDFLIRTSKCNEDPQGDIEPTYGNLLNDHHSSYWRAWHNNKLDKKLKRMPK